jgi:hypothetical protein
VVAIVRHFILLLNWTRAAYFNAETLVGLMLNGILSTLVGFTTMGLIFVFKSVCSDYPESWRAVL